MNQKTAKRLRKVAFGMVQAAEQQGRKAIPKVGYVVNPSTGQIQVTRQSWKGAYKALKNGLRKEHMSSAWSPKLTTPAQRKAAIST